MRCLKRLLHRFIGFRVRWKTIPDQQGFWLRWERGRGDALVYVDPSDKAFVAGLVHGKNPARFLGPFQLPIE